MQYDLIIRGGNVVDGTGAPPFVGDVAVKDGLIAAVGTVTGDAAREIDAKGLLVTPGFVDVHTHYDGQAIWSERMAPSSSHGVTTVVMGNCGVGFAPCRPADHDLLVDVMSGVEDIPGAVMAEGLPWTWETFPEYLDALESRRRDIDVAAYMPHTPLRVYVMGDRGAAREPATAEDLTAMRGLMQEAVQAGARGWAPSQRMFHKTGSGDAIPTYAAAAEELRAIAEGMRDAGGGLLQFVPEIPFNGYEAVLRPMFEIARDTDQKLTFTLATGNSGPQIYQGALKLIEEVNASGGNITAQMFPRPIGLIMGLELTAHPFVLCPSYKAIAQLPLAERVAELRKPETRARILLEEPEQGHPLTQMSRNWEWIFPLDEVPNYEPAAAESIAARAAANGTKPEVEAYERLLDEDGHNVLLLALGNFLENSLDTLGPLMQRDDVVIGLGDGGAHYGMISDSSYPTFLLSHWARDRSDGRLSVAQAVKALTSATAGIAGLHDRGRIAAGFKADLNVIDHAELRLHRPSILHDLPGGGRRLDQRADGYVATIVSGEIIAEHGIATAALPGRLVRGRQAAPV
jgi:N-acyl-D-amino-acid deacylase